MNENMSFNGFEIFVFDELQSTNDFLHDRISAGIDIDDTVVVARHQTAGKGMGNNRWESQDGKNLLFSIALNVSFLKAEEQFKISQAVAVAILNVISTKLLNVSNSLISSIKWPNDIYINSRKLAGMLIQNTISGMMMQTSIVGIGLNVNQMEFDDNVPNPVSLKMLTGIDFDLDLLLKELIINIKTAVESLRTESGKLSVDEIYRNNLFRFGQWADYEIDNEIKTLIINGYDKYGRLCLCDKNGHDFVCDIKEIRFIV
ncbi:MAG: biotin--[acetyl-CoA-carboxylase] ligase [Bacteroidales bacterium]|nr:biotin--[acetyl-CoA-carboxylase] ligase [Bacteroidales bacterium]